LSGRAPAFVSKKKVMPYLFSRRGTGRERKRIILSCPFAGGKGAVAGGPWFLKRQLTFLLRILLGQPFLYDSCHSHSSITLMYF